ncbi:hypothetical protein SAMN05216249_10956 [Acetitomaculum ruminis DSM 5522]|uniref:Yip1 domain-containing protein n=1 Tax=Acetitomaculum ruminis DSM 5522 TaxID=1120918 RepID=A0A1I0Y9Z1_9FIRM|nr:hypothetical protein [Acetitomaculum ruminis]SFB10094.1 hypothetical protein SAMN05216249_10956 [Acetitomaculum ruminis DSM 5522]
MYNYCPNCGRKIIAGEPCVCTLPNYSENESTPDNETLTNNSNVENNVNTYVDNINTNVNSGVFVENTQETVNSEPEKLTGYDNLVNLEKSTTGYENASNVMPDSNAVNQENFFINNNEVNAQNVRQDNAFTRMLKIFIEVLKAPVSEGKTFTAFGGNLQALGFILFQAILTGIFAVVVEYKVGTVLKSFFGSYLNYTNINIPFVRVFFITVLMSVLFTLLLAGLILIASLLTGNNGNYRMMLCILATKSIVVTPLILFATLVAIFNINFGMGLFYVGNLLTIMLIAMLMPVKDSKSSNFLPLVLTIAFILYSIITSVISISLISAYSPVDFNDIYNILSDFLSEYMYGGYEDFIY